ncbi:unnamed protein product [Boreogadus saida]
MKGCRRALWLSVASVPPFFLPSLKQRAERPRQTEQSKWRLTALLCPPTSPPCSERRPADDSSCLVAAGRGSDT